MLGRLNLAQQNPGRAIETLKGILQRPEGVSHSLLIATLFTLADAHLQAGTPEAGDDPLEEFIDHHPEDAALPAIFARLDQLYRKERKPSTNELGRWMRDPAQPTRMLAKYDSGDHLHPSDAGYQAMANAFDLALVKEGLKPGSNGRR